MKRCLFFILAASIGTAHPSYRAEAEARVAARELARREAEIRAEEQRLIEKDTQALIAFFKLVGNGFFYTGKGIYCAGRVVTGTANNDEQVIGRMALAVGVTLSAVGIITLLLSKK